MPVYNYCCETHGEFEVEHSIKTQLNECPKCKEEGLEPKEFKRLISKTNFALLGGAWASTNYS